MSRGWFQFSQTRHTASAKPGESIVLLRLRVPNPDDFDGEVVTGRSVEDEVSPLLPKGLCDGLMIWIEEEKK